MSQLTEPTTPEKPDISGNEERQTANVASKPAAPANLLECPPHNTQQLLGWLLEKKSDAISQHFIRVLEYLDKKLYVQLSDSAKYYVNRVVQDFLYIMAQPEYVISVSYARRFVELNTVIANAVSMTPFENTDRCLDMVCHARQSKDNAAKVCALYSSRNRKKIDRRAIVSANPGLASLWYSSYMGNYTVALADPECLERMREHILFADDRLDLTQGHPASVYYGATYVDHENDRHVKRRINEAFQKRDAHIVFKRKPRTVDKPKIAVISDLWRKNHSACRVQYQYVAALKEHFHLTLLHSLFGDLKKFDTELFDETIWIGDGRGSVNVAPILENDFDIAYFPDVGMTDPSIRIANMRIAPVQIMGPGHPVSTWGSQIDYFVTGVENELPGNPNKHYSEKLILLPGLGAIHNPITHPRKGRAPSEDPVIINCPWSPQKTNYPLLKMLAKVLTRVQKRVIFRFFPLNYAVRSCGAVAFKRNLESVLGKDHVDIRHGLDYASYMDMLEEGAFSIDSYPYGGGNVIADSLYMRRPIVCLEGEHWYNRMGAAMLRYVGMETLVSKDESDFVSRISTLVDNIDERNTLTDRLQQAPVDNSLFSNASQNYLKDVIDRLYNNQRIKERQSIKSSSIKVNNASLEIQNQEAKKHVVLYSDDYGQGGVAIYNDRLAHGLVDSGFRVTMVQSYTQSAMTTSRSERGIAHHWIPYDTRADQIRNSVDETVPEALFQLIAPDIVVFSNCSPYSHIAAKNVAIRRNLPFVVIEGYVAPYSAVDANIKWHLSQIENHYRQAKAVIAVSKQNLDLLRSHFGLDAQKGEVIHYGRPDSFFDEASANQRLAVRKELQIGENDIVCLTLARLEVVKGYQHQLAAIDAIRDEKIFHRLHFIWAGNGSQFTKLGKHVSGIGLSNKIHLVGHRDDSISLLAASDIFVLPSHYEGMPIAVMEAMAMGLPVIATSVSGIPEEVGDTGILLTDPKINPLSTEKELAQAIVKLGSDPVARHKIGSRARERASGLFRESRMIRQTTDVLSRSLLPDGDYVSPGLVTITPDQHFPNMVVVDATNHPWPYVRREVPHRWYCDRRFPGTGFLNRDEAALLYNLALPFSGQRGLEIGCWLGWSACHIAMAGVKLDVIDPVLGRDDFHKSVSDCLRSAGVLERVCLVTGTSPNTVHSLFKAENKPWAFFFIDGNHDAPYTALDAEVCCDYAAENAMIVFHDLASPDVAQGLEHLKLRGWDVLVYQTMQIMGVAWRGNVKPIMHRPDPLVQWHLPHHLRTYKISGLE